MKKLYNTEIAELGFHRTSLLMYGVYIISYTKTKDELGLSVIESFDTKADCPDKLLGDNNIVSEHIRSLYILSIGGHQHVLDINSYEELKQLTQILFNDECNKKEN